MTGLFATGTKHTFGDTYVIFKSDFYRPQRQREEE